MISVTLTDLFSSSLFLSSLLISIFNAFPVHGFQLDFSDIQQTLDIDGNPIDNNLTDGDTDGVGATMRFTGVDPDDQVDLIITTLNEYQPNNPSNNGAVRNNDGRINMPRNSSTTFRFSFVDTGTNTLFTVSEAEIGIYDIDGGDVDGSQERVILKTAGEYTVTDSASTALTIEITDSGDLQFTSPGISITNPTNSNNLTATQENHSVSFKFNNLSEFDLGYEIVGGTNTQNRNFFFAGDVIFTETTEIVDFEPVPFEFSPSLGLLLSSASLFGANYLRKRRVSSKKLGKQ